MSTTASHLTHFTVTGMTCGHCVAAVTEEVTALEGVSSVEVDLETGALTVHSQHALSREAVARAVDDAGYALA